VSTVDAEEESAIAHDVSTDNQAGVTWSSALSAPIAGGNVGIYFANNGPGAITFANPAFSVKGVMIPRGETTVIAVTPEDSTAVFWDRFWGGTFSQGVDQIGCTTFSNVSLAGGNQANAHLDLSFYRGTTLYTVRVNVHLR